jgi:hypothetical protein
MGEHLSQISVCCALVEVDVMHTRAIQLVLPARNAVKHTDGSRALREEIERSVYEWLIYKSTAPSGKYVHALPYAVYKRAKDHFNLDIGEAEFCLMPYVACYSAHAAADRVRIDTDTAQWSYLAALLQQYERAHGPHERGLHVFYDKPAMEGYTWYDAIPAVKEVVARVDGTELAHAWRAYLTDEESSGELAEKCEIHRLVNTIETEMHLSDGRKILLKSPVLIAGCEQSSDWDYSTGNRIYIDRAAVQRLDGLNAVADILFSSLFAADDECDVSAEEQERLFQRDVMSWLFTICGQDKQAKRCRMLAAVEHMDYAARSDDTAWTLRYDGRLPNEGIRLVSFQTAKEEDSNHQIVVFSRTGKPLLMDELVSDKPLTIARIQAYLNKQYQITPGDEWFAQPVLQEVNLDAWEVEQGAQAAQEGVTS